MRSAKTKSQMRERISGGSRANKGEFTAFREALRCDVSDAAPVDRISGLDKRTVLSDLAESC